MRNVEKFWDRIANRYAKSPLKNMDAYNETLDHTRAHLSEGDNVLEVGCGTGATALLLADGVKQITAIDISSNMISIAQGKAMDQKIENVNFVHSTLKDEALKIESVDVVLAFNILHLLDDLPGEIPKISKKLKPGGMFISKSVCMGEKSKLWPVLLFPFQTLGIIPRFKIMKIRELDDFITEQDFRIIETGLYPAEPPNRFVVAQKK